MEGTIIFMRKRKYSAELIISIVKERIENETSYAIVCGFEPVDV